jgi:hypothetical protein
MFCFFYKPFLWVIPIIPLHLLPLNSYSSKSLLISSNSPTISPNYYSFINWGLGCYTLVLMYPLQQNTVCIFICICITNKCVYIVNKKWYTSIYNRNLSAITKLKRSDKLQYLILYKNRTIHLDIILTTLQSW